MFYLCATANTSEISDNMSLLSVELIDGYTDIALTNNSITVASWGRGPTPWYDGSTRKFLSGTTKMFRNLIRYGVEVDLNVNQVLIVRVFRKDSFKVMRYLGL